MAGANSNVNHIHARPLIALALSQNQGNPLSRQCHEYEMAVRFTGRIPKNITSRPILALTTTRSGSEKLPDGPCLAKPIVVTINAQEMITGNKKCSTVPPCEASLTESYEPPAWNCIQ